MEVIQNTMAKPTGFIGKHKKKEIRYSSIYSKALITRSIRIPIRYI